MLNRPRVLRLPLLFAAAPARLPLPGGSRKRENNVFADRQGNVFRKISGGGWEKRTSSSWARAIPAAPSQGLPQVPRVQRDLDLRDRSRSLGQERVREVAPHASTSPSFHEPSPSHSSSSSPPPSSRK